MGAIKIFFLLITMLFVGCTNDVGFKVVESYDVVTVHWFCGLKTDMVVCVRDTIYNYEK